jgi:hypothetical protein
MLILLLENLPLCNLLTIRSVIIADVKNFLILFIPTAGKQKSGTNKVVDSVSTGVAVI